MKRSFVNQTIREADEYIRSFGHILPPFAYLSPSEMQARKDDIRGIIDARLGWDITDYAKGNFQKMGLFLFTTRNGRLTDLKAGGGMCYAEKLMISRHDQISPMHRHVVKAEDIINRGGATLAIKMYESAADGTLDPRAAVTVACDGIEKTFEAGHTLMLAPGESVTLMPGNWHRFWGEGGDVLIGEVSTVNDDETDNIFHPPLDRFSGIEEDEEPLHLLVSDYKTWLS